MRHQIDIWTGLLLIFTNQWTRDTLFSNQPILGCSPSESKPISAAGTTRGPRRNQQSKQTKPVSGSHSVPWWCPILQRENAFTEWQPISRYHSIATWRTARLRDDKEAFKPQSSTQTYSDLPGMSYFHTYIIYHIYIYMYVCVFYRLLYINGPKYHKISSKRSTEAATKNDPKRCCLCLLGFHLTSMESPRKRVWKTKLLLKLSIEISWGLNCCWFQLLNGISSSLCCAKVPEAPFASHCARCMQTPDAGSVETCRSWWANVRKKQWMVFCVWNTNHHKGKTIGLVQGKIYRKPLFFLWHMGLSCIFSLKPIQG